ncbi:hypothetical protein AKO1_006326 [Acrasis kona]|uniref:Uncharacterized protein n=1 Tax=Acrasis kona TaxID=1008807 RepID=A0AAW2YH77_9EUKA
MESNSHQHLYPSDEILERQNNVFYTELPGVVMMKLREMNSMRKEGRLELLWNARQTHDDKNRESNLPQTSVKTFFELMIYYRKKNKRNRFL